MAIQSKIGALWGLGVLLAGLSTEAAFATPPPNTISPPKGLNLGSTSFFDGMGRESEGWSLVEYDRFENLNSINGPTGRPSPLFNAPHIVVGVALTQLIYTTPWRPLGGHFAFSAALPAVDLMQSSFATNSRVKLGNNGAGVGDLVWGPIFQSRAYLKNGRPRFVWRTQLIVSTPTGQINSAKDINQGVGYWAINPYITFSFFPTDKLEFSNRLNYQYNLSGTRFSNPPPIPALIYKSGQAGQIVYDNFAASYGVSKHVNLGLNGYVLIQLTPDLTNGVVVPRSRENEFYLGPGAHVSLNETNAVNLNSYFKVVSNNAVSGPQFNMQITHRF